MHGDDGEVEGKDVMEIIENIKKISKHICWVPTKMAQLEEWRAFLKGLAGGVGLEVEFEPTIAETDEEFEKSE
jgi:hypothetical protein